MTVAATGHRPDKLGGYNQKAFEKLYDIAFDWLMKEQPHKCISGMALGWDQAFAKAAMDLGIKVIAAIPFKGQSDVWPVQSRNFYNKLLKNELCRKVIVNDGAYQYWFMQTRNEWMVDHCDKLLAMWDGSTGGTYNCIKYARKKEIEIINLYKSL